jgi:PBSX family phage terminase large subunit
MFDFKPFSQKQLDVIRSSDAFINILEGSVRSGKTIASIVAWIYFVYSSPHRVFLMTGGTSDTLYRNVIEDIEKILGPKRARYVKSAKGGGALRLTFKNPDYPRTSKRRSITKICYCIGASDHRSEGRIRGMTVGGWYADEVTLHPESVVKQATNRMSLKGARAFWTTNPDSPFHYIKTEFIDQAKEKGYKHWHFRMEDNLALDEHYIGNIKRSYSGLWYKRMVDGLWVQAEGAIYDMWNDENIVDSLPPNYRYNCIRFIGCDKGTQNATVYLDCWDDGDTLYIARTYYHSGAKSTRQKEEAEYADDLGAFLKEFESTEEPVAIVLDPTAASFKVALRHRGYLVRDAENEVLEGIRRTQTMIAQRKIKVLDNESNKALLKEISNYVWDAKAVERGDERPLKKDDHAVDALRYSVMTMINVSRIYAM